MTAGPLYSELFGDSFILPSQMPKRAKILNTGEKRLMFAVLEDAVHCALMAPVPRDWKNAPECLRGRPWDEALRWMLETDWDWPFSFVNICETLKFDPEAVREQVKRTLAERRSPIVAPR